jgi:Pentapeptide repeats (8 copies)
MANDEHVAVLKKGVEAWNKWREKNHSANLRGVNFSKAILAGAELRGADLSEANLSGAILRKATLAMANLSGADLRGADLSEADLSDAKLGRADLRGANLRGADLIMAKLFRANLSEANLASATLALTNLNEANLTRADLRCASLMRTDFTGADLTGGLVFGVSAWGVKLEKAKQQNLIITDPVENEPSITVDNIEVAQFVYLLLHNEKIRDVIDTVGKKGVLLLGRFTEGRMAVLERLRDKLRDLGFVPMVFNFDKPETKDFSETVRLLANLSKFVIVDVTNPRSTPLELQATVPDYMVPFAPILQQGEEPFAMFVDLQNKYDWVLQPVVGYPSVDRLIEVLEDKVVRPAEAKFNELLARRTNQLRVENI